MNKFLLNEFIFINHQVVFCYLQSNSPNYCIIWSMKHYIWHIESAQKLVTVGEIFWYLDLLPEVGTSLPALGLKRWAGFEEACALLEVPVALTKGIKISPFAMAHSVGPFVSIHETVVGVCPTLWGGPTVYPDMRATFSYDTRNLEIVSWQLHPRSRDQFLIFLFWGFMPHMLRHQGTVYKKWPSFARVTTIKRTDDTKSWQG